MKTRIILGSIFISMFLTTAYAEIPTPQESLGFQVGADFHLAKWETIVDYFSKVGQESDRVLVEEIGRSTENAPYIMATVSSPDTIQQVKKYQNIQRLISHPNEITGDESLILSEAKTVILVSCSLHSNEIAASQMAMELLYELATGTDDKTREILDNTIILLVPSANPDGINKVIDWYEKSLGTPWEGTGMPWLYQKYVGHDDNRDWFMLTQKESQILTRILYHQWYPAIIYDIHQMGSSGARFFIPPFFDPINPNVDPLIHESLKLIGGAMATQFAMENKKGIITNAIYDNWWHGGNRTTPYRHNIVGLLTEAASPRIASPLFQRESDLSGHSRGLPKYQPQVNFADPWPGGWWRLRDVVEYEKTACYALFTNAARYRHMFNRNYLALGKKAIRLGKEEPPFAYLIPARQRDDPSAVRMMNIMMQGGIEIETAQETFTADGVDYPKGTYIIHAAQPYRNHIRDLLDPQIYPERKLYPGGPAEAPYDMAGWTLSYQMGVTVIRVKNPFPVKTQPVLTSVPLQGSVQGDGRYWITPNTSTHDFILLNRALKESIHVVALQKPAKVRNKDKEIPAGSLVYYMTAQSKQKKMQGWVNELGLDVITCSSLPEPFTGVPIQPSRLALYQPWTASMDEGWTRFILEEFEFDFTSLHNAEIQAGNLHDRYDVIVIPDLGTGTILNGRKINTTAPQYVGGMDEEGVAQLQTFVADGGRLLCLDSSCMFAIQYFDLPLKNALSSLKSSEFYCPGSLLRIRLNPGNPVAYGMDKYAAACFKHSYAFELNKKERNSTNVPIGKPITISTYDNTLTLMSGWILGEKYLYNKAAIVSVPYGKGDIVLYGFRVQHRGQSHGTFRLLFNGIVHGKP